MAAKAKKSFTLSHASVAFLENLRRERQVASTSQVLDELIREMEARRRRTVVERSVEAYYSKLAPEEEREQRAWGEFALAQWNKEGA